MTIVTDICPSANATPATATAGVQAKRIGTTLRERFQSYIHKRECSDSNSQQYNEKMASRAIAAFAISCHGGVDDVTAGSAVCDSSDDGGIDAIYVSHVDKLLIAVQAKFNQNGQSTWNTADFLRFKDACSKLQRQEYSRFDQQLQAISSDIDVALDSMDYKFLFVMAHTGKTGAADEILSDMQEWQAELNEAACVDVASISPNDYPFQVHIFSAEDITNAIQGQSLSAINLQDVELSEYGKILDPYEAYFGIITADQISEWWENHGQQLFSKNIRNILGNTDVNESIKKTAINSPENFWFYNNGITVLVKSANSHRRNVSTDRTRGLFSFSDISVINGAQTVSSLGILAKQNTIDEESLRKIKIQSRFIVIEDTNVVRSITRANNHQNRVLGRDFASQETEQIRLSKELIIDGYTYQLLRNNENTIFSNKVITIDDALNALVCAGGTPSTVVTLKSQRGKFFDNLEGSLYRSVFNSSVSSIRVINTVKLSRVIESIIDDKSKNINKLREKKIYGILTHGNRYLSAMIFHELPIWRSTDIITVDEDVIAQKFDSLLSRTEDFITENHDGAYLARLFTNVEKTSHMMSVIKQNISSVE